MSWARHLKEQILGIDPNQSLGIASESVHIDGRRNWEVYKLASQAYAMATNPHPELAMRGTAYDGLRIRYADGPAPTIQRHDPIPEMESGDRAPGPAC